MSRYAAVSSADNLTWDLCNLFREAIYVDKEENRSVRDTRYYWYFLRLTLSKTTVCDLPFRKALIQNEDLPLTPYPCSLWMSFSWLTLSKALLKSSNIRSVFYLPAGIGTQGEVG